MLEHTTQNPKSCTTSFINHMSCQHTEGDVVIRIQSVVSLHKTIQGFFSEICWQILARIQRERDFSTVHIL